MQDLVTFLHADGLITRSESLAIKKASRHLHENPVRVLRSLNIASPLDIQNCFQLYFNFPLVTDSLIDNLTGEYASLVPVDLATHYSVFGFGEEGNRLYVGLEDPTDRATLGALSFFLNRELLPSAANVYQLSRALEKLYGLDEKMSGLETVLDQARGAGAWSKSERELFDKILEERAARESEMRQNVTIVPTGLPQPQEESWAHPVEPPPEPASEPEEAALPETAVAEATEVDVSEPELGEDAGAFTADIDLAEVETEEQPPAEPVSLLDSIDEDELEELDDDDFAVESDLVELSPDPTELPEAAQAGENADEPELEEPAADFADFDEGWEGSEPEAEPELAEPAAEFADFDEGLENSEPLSEPVQEPEVEQDALLDEPMADVVGLEAAAEREALAAPSAQKLSLLAGRARIKLSLCGSAEERVNIANSLFDAVGVVFERNETGGVDVICDGEKLSEEQLQEAPWSQLAKVLALLVQD